MCPVGADGVRRSRHIDVGTGANAAGARAGKGNAGTQLILIEVAQKEMILAGGLPVEAAKLFLIIEWSGNGALYAGEGNGGGDSTGAGDSFKYRGTGGRRIADRNSIGAVGCQSGYG